MLALNDQFSVLLPVGTFWQPLLKQLPRLMCPGPKALPQRWWAVLWQMTWSHDQQAIRRLGLDATLQESDPAVLAALAYAPFERVLGTLIEE